MAVEDEGGEDEEERERERIHGESGWRVVSGEGIFVCSI